MPVAHITNRNYFTPMYIYRLFIVFTPDSNIYNLYKADYEWEETLQQCIMSSSVLRRLRFPFAWASELASLNLHMLMRCEDRMYGNLGEKGSRTWRLMWPCGRGFSCVCACVCACVCVRGRGRWMDR